MIKIAHVKIWEHEVGVAAWDTDKGYASFEYYRDFLKLGLNIAPLHMGLDDARRSDAIYSFPSMNFETYRGLPGLLADALPDKYGDSIIDAWLTRQKRSYGRHGSRGCTVAGRPDPFPGPDPSTGTQRPVRTEYS